jgi:hypothetical protein
LASMDFFGAATAATMGLLNELCVFLYVSLPVTDSASSLASVILVFRVATQLSRSARLAAWKVFLWPWTVK